MYRPSVQEVEEIRNEISKGPSRFENVISMPIFPLYLATQQTDLIDYLLKNFQLVFSSALGLNQSKPVVQNRCLLLFTDEKNLYNKIITQDKIFLQLLVSFVSNVEKYKPKTKTAYFTILCKLGQQIPELYTIFSSEKILPYVLKNITNNQCNSFISALISNPNHRKEINAVNLPSILIKTILRTEGSKQEMIDLFLQLLSTSYIDHNQIAESLIANNELAQFIQDAIEQPQTCEFSFIKELLRNSYQNSKNKSWSNISTVIESRSKDIIAILLKSERFNATSEAISLLVLEMLKHSNSDISNDILDVFYKLQTDFFKYPKHGILHNTFILFLRELNNKKYLSFEFLNSIHLFDTAYMICDENNKFVSYIPQIREICLLIDPYFHKTDKVTETQWNRLIRGIKEKQTIIKKPYGGNISKINKKHVAITILTIIAVIIIIFLIYLFILYRKILYRRNTRF